MPVADLVRDIRTDFLDDNTPAKYLWSTAQLTRYVNEGIKEACRRAPLIRRTKTVTVADTVADYALDPSIRQIEHAKLALGDTPLLPCTEADLDMSSGLAWRDRTGTPTHYVRKGQKIRLYPTPLVDDTLTLATTNLPDDDFDLDDDIDSAYHEAIMLYACYKAYMLNDADTYNPVKAAQFLVMFNDKFGDGNTAKYDAASFSTPMYATLSGARLC